MLAQTQDKMSMLSAMNGAAADTEGEGEPEDANSDRPNSGVARSTSNSNITSSNNPSSEVVGDDSMVVGKGIMIKGDVDDCATLIVEGYFEGNYRGGFLAVPKGGKYVGMADVRRADIGGRLHGTISARTLLEVRSTGKIEGMVRHNELKMEQGGSMVGDIQRGVKSQLGSL